MPTIGELTGWAIDPQKREESDIRNELSHHPCKRCIVEKRLKKDRQSEFRLLTETQRSIYRETSRLPHRCTTEQFRLFKYEKCECKHVGEVHVEEAFNVYSKCNMKNCPCTRYRCANV